ncbi:unnamed protein product [Brassica oleracea]|nr:unnamed protein product [Brassica napus]
MMILWRTCSEEDGEAERVWGLITEAISFTKKVLFTTLLRKPLEKEIMGLSGRYDKVLKTFLEEHENVAEKQGMNLMDVLLEAKGDGKSEYNITRDHIKSLFVELLSGGTDTSKQTIQWTMAEIINNPSTMERMGEEIDSVVGKSKLILETDLPKLPYLQAVVKEGLRLYPPIPVFGRRLQEGCVMGGFYVSDKTTLVVNGYAVMRDSDYWEYPVDFKPERFLASEQEDATKEKVVLKYLPFGSGRRACPAKKSSLYLFRNSDWNDDSVFRLEDRRRQG